MLQHYVLANLGLFFSYWSGRPAVTVAVLLPVFLIEVGIFESISGASSSDLKEIALYRVFSLLFGVIVGGGLSLVLDKPLYPLIDILKNWVYHLLCLCGTLLWIGSVLTWQLAPQAWWNYTFLGLVVHVLLVVASYFLVNHNKAWSTPQGSNDSAIVHWQFLVVNTLFLDLPFVVGQSVSTVWPFYFSIAFFGASTLYAFLLNSCHPIRVAGYVTVLVSEPNHAVERL